MTDHKEPAAALEPCPFCGGDAEIQSQYGVEFWPQCTNLECGCTNGKVYTGSRKCAVLDWNRRPPKASAVPEALQAWHKAETKRRAARAVHEALDVPRNRDHDALQAAIRDECVASSLAYAALKALYEAVALQQKSEEASQSIITQSSINRAVTKVLDPHLPDGKTLNSEWRDRAEKYEAERNSIQESLEEEQDQNRKLEAALENATSKWKQCEQALSRERLTHSVELEAAKNRAEEAETQLAVLRNLLDLRKLLLEKLEVKGDFSGLPG